MAQLQICTPCRCSVAAIAAWIFGGLYYGILRAERWMAAQGKTLEQCKAENAGKSDHTAKVTPLRPLLYRRTDHGLDAVRHPVPFRHSDAR